MRLLELEREIKIYAYGNFNSSIYMPTQKSMEMELFEVKERTINDPNGSVRVIKTPKVTGKGQQYFINKFLGAPVQ